MPTVTNISLTTTGGGTTSVPTSGKITFTNNTTESITGFSLPSCVSPQNDPAPIAVGATTQQYQINNSANGDYTYSYTVAGTTGDALSGTIDVS